MESVIDYYEYSLNILDQCDYFYFIAPVFILLYWLYYRKYRDYIFLQHNDIKNSSKPRGKCPAFFPNGWFRLCNSDELKINEVKYFDYCGRDVAVFRGSNGNVYALHAFCSHMGANLGKGGVVKHTQCIQCPFHGWLFDGETGNSVVSESLIKKHVEKYEYHELNKMEKVDGNYLKKCYEGNVKLKKYIIKECHNSILIWYDSRKEHQDNYLYEPFEFDHDLEYRGESINFVNCHMQEIPEKYYKSISIRISNEFLSRISYIILSVNNILHYLFLKFHLK